MWGKNFWIIGLLFSNKRCILKFLESFGMFKMVVSVFFILL